MNLVKTYNKVFRKVCNAAKKANSKFIENSENRSKAAWHVLNSELGLKRNNTYESFDRIQLNDIEIVEGNKTASSFNEEFINVAKLMFQHQLRMLSNFN